MTADEYFDRAQAHFEKEEYAEVEQALRESLAEFPDNARTHHQLAAVALRQGRPKDAVEHCAAAARVDPYFAAAYLDGADILSCDLHCTDRALQVVEFGLKALPNDAELHFERGIYCEALNDRVTAEQSYAKAVAFFPTYADALINLGRLQTEPGKYLWAINHLNRGIQLAPECAEAYHYRAVCYVSEGYNEWALRDYGYALQLQPDWEFTHELLASLLLGIGNARRGDFRRALFHARRACELGGWRKWDAIATYAAALAWCGDFDGAIHQLERAMQIAPANVVAGQRHRQEAYRRQFSPPWWNWSGNLPFDPARPWWTFQFTQRELVYHAIGLTVLVALLAVSFYNPPGTTAGGFMLFGLLPPAFYLIGLRSGRDFFWRNYVAWAGLLLTLLISTRVYGSLSGKALDFGPYAGCLFAALAWMFGTLGVGIYHLCQLAKPSFERGIERSVDLTVGKALDAASIALGGHISYSAEKHAVPEEELCAHCARPAAVTFVFPAQPAGERRGGYCYEHAPDEIDAWSARAAPPDELIFPRADGSEFVAEIVTFDDARDYCHVGLRERGSARRLWIVVDLDDCAAVSRTVLGRPASTPTVHESLLAVTQTLGGEIVEMWFDSSDGKTYTATGRLRRGKEDIPIPFAAGAGIAIAIARQATVVVSEAAAKLGCAEFERDRAEQQAKRTPAKPK